MAQHATDFYDDLYPPNLPVIQQAFGEAAYKRLKVGYNAVSNRIILSSRWDAKEITRHPQEASCVAYPTWSSWHKDDPPKHKAPQERCSCGFYGFKNAAHSELLPLLTSEPLAEVYFQGTMIECDDGYRAQWQTVINLSWDIPAIEILDDRIQIFVGMDAGVNKMVSIYDVMKQMPCPSSYKGKVYYPDV